MPTRLPLVARYDKLLQRSCKEQVGQRPACGGMANDDDGCAGPLPPESGKEVVYALDNLTIAFAVGKRCFNMQPAHSLDVALV